MRGRILIVEGDSGIRRALRRHFRAHGYEVLLASRGDRALRICRRKPPDAIVLDTTMTSADGDQVCQGIRDEPGTQHVPIILILPPGARDDEFGSKARGLAHDYVTKPFDIEELRLRVQGAISRARRERRNLNETRSKV